jgi:hypothetical protein
MKVGTSREGGSLARRRALTGVAGLALVFVVAVVLPAGAGGAPSSAKATKGLWQSIQSMPAAQARSGARPQIAAKRVRAFTLDRAGLQSVLAAAPDEGTNAAETNPLVVSLPAPDGSFQRFELAESEIMAPGLAAKHPDIKTYSGVGVDDPAATIHADLTPLGFHASVRSPQGAWYVDPYYLNDQSAYVSYYGRAMPKDPAGPFVERDADAAELSLDKGYYHAADTVTLNGSGFDDGASVTLRIVDPEGGAAERSVSAQADANGSFVATFVADPDGKLGDRIVSAGNAMAAYQVVRDDDPTSDPPTGDVLRTYRLAMITDPGYAAYHGGPANVTPAKVTLVNRVSQVYEDDLSIRLQLIAGTDLLNLNDWGAATAPNGPCGSAACFTQSQVTGCSSTTRARFVIGQIIGASGYDIGHLALGQPGGGVANLGVVGRSNKAGGCTGIPTPTGDFYAIDYVAHEMGHQFSGNHPFNGNQLNCSGGNRNAATSVEPGSGSSIMAYAGICLTDDLQPHSDPYFSQRSLQEISTYTASNQAAINEVQTASLRRFGGGNEVQVATFGPGYQQASTTQPLSVAIGAAPSATQLGGLSEDGNTVTVSTGAAGSTHTLQPGDVFTISGAGNAGYNGTWTVDTVLTSRAFTYTNPTAGLPRTGGGTITLAAPGLSEVGNTVTVRTVAAHNRSVGDIVVVAGAGVAGYNGTYTITSVPSARSFTYTNPTAGLANSGGGSTTYSSPFQVRIGGNDSAVVGGSSQAYTAANLQAAINAIPGFAGTVTVSGLASTGFTLTYGGASAGLDLANAEIVNLSCGGCYASVEETNHGGANDSFRLNYDGNVSALITNGTNYTAAGVLAALTPLLPAGATATVAGFAGGGFNNTGFQVTFGGTLATTNVPVTLALQDFTGAASGFVGETDKGGAVDNKGGIITPTGNAWPAVTAPAPVTIPIRTPFALTGQATDPDGDPMTVIWEQNDRGGGAGSALLLSTKADGPLFAMFPKSGIISETDTLLYHSPGQNHIGSDPTRVFPDLQQILDNNTNAETGSCPTGPIAPPVPIPLRECYAEFLPNASYVGSAAAGNASPARLNFRFTARDGKGGVNAADTTLTLAPGAGPFLVTSPNTAVSYLGNSTQTVTWDPANTQNAPVSTANVKISLSTDGGYTYPVVLAASTPNDGSEDVTLPNAGTSAARIKIEAVGNIFFDLSNANFQISSYPVVSSSGDASVQYSDAIAPDLVVSASDDDADGSDLMASATGLPAGLSLATTSVSAAGVRPGTHAWKVAGTANAAPGDYPVTVTVTDGDGLTGSTTFTITVTEEDADATYVGDDLVFTTGTATSAPVVLRANVLDSSLVPAFGDAAPGDIRKATVTFEEEGTTLCGPIPVSLLNGDTRTGTASCTKSLALGSHEIDVIVGGWYTGADDAVLVVAEPGNDHVNGAGELAASSSAGTYPANGGSKVKFGLDAKYKGGKGKKPKDKAEGHVTITFTSGSKRYEIKARTIDALGVDQAKPNGDPCAGPSSLTCFGLADIRTTATLTDVTPPPKGKPKPKKPVVASGLTLVVTFTDKGNPGKERDYLGITLWQGNKLLFSSRWSGAETLEQLLAKGNLHVH